MNKEFEALERLKTAPSFMGGTEKYRFSINSVSTLLEDYELVKQALQRLDKYEQILGSGRLTDRNYKNTTLDLDSCKPYLRLGELEDIYEGGK